MSEKTIPAFRTIGSPLEVDDRELDAVNQRLGVPVLQRPALNPVAPAPEPRGKAPLEKLSHDFPDYLALELRRKAVETKTSVWHLIMLALRQAGYTIDEVDMVPDGRRVRNRPR